MSDAVFPSDFPQIETKRLVLRELTQRDAQAVFQNYADEDIANNFMDAPFTDIEQAKRLIDAFTAEYKQGQAITWAISLSESDACIGTCSCMIKSSSTAEIGYDLAKTQWGKGLMSEALHAVIAYSFEHLGVREINADTLSNNSRSIYLLNKLGFNLDDIRDNSHYFSLQKSMDTK